MAVSRSRSLVSTRPPPFLFSPSLHAFQPGLQGPEKPQDHTYDLPTNVIGLLHTVSLHAHTATAFNSSSLHFVDKLWSQ